MRRPPTLLLAIAVAAVAIAAVVAVAGSGSGGAGDGSAAAPATSPASTSAEPAPTGAGATDAAPAVVWPAPPDPVERTIAAGLQPEPKEYLTNHVHAHLDVFVDGKPIVVPAGIGIDVDNPDVRRFDEPDGSVAYGGISLCATPCISPLHTHDALGIIHTESATPEPNTLGQFFVEWGVVLTDSCVGEVCRPEPIAVYVNGELYSDDPRAIELTDRKEIAIVLGTPPPTIPSTADFSRA
jgi:hypothetical protein